jgi:hypothetical protein|tara:strand:- start:36 stop:860 length:825 start_codon:yes stop_codon:yes gene_type:complete
MKFKHNKKRNTAFLFEVMIKELTKATVNNNQAKKQKISQLIKEFFSKDAILGKELHLYKQISETYSIREKDAEKLLEEVKRVYWSLDSQNIFNAQSNLVSKANKEVSAQMFTNFVPNYKNLASIAQIFNKKISPKERVLLERSVAKRMTFLPAEQKKEELALTGTEMKIFAKKFNSSYGDLYKEQKELLSRFVSSFQDNGLELKIFLNEEIGRLKIEMKNAKALEDVNKDPEMLNKAQKVLEILNNFKGQIIDEALLTKILKLQNLAREIKDNG